MSSKSYGSGKLSREDYRKQKELEEARKAGTAPPEVDEEGNVINPHIPKFMSEAPWYMDTGKRGLQHQRKADNGNDDDNSGLHNAKWYTRGTPSTTRAPQKYRKGACENCGALTHKTKECVERPRKRGARWTGKNLKGDEVVEDLNLSYEAKRDRWNGYNPSEHVKIMREWDLIEEARKKRKASELDKSTAKNTNDPTAADIENTFGSSDEENDDEDKYVGTGAEKVNAKSKSTVRNLRIREDTAKYLRNLDPDSAYYDPKTRSMRENPYAGKDPSQLVYAGDNFVRFTGDAQSVAQMEVFAWEAQERGNDAAHFQANPTQTALMHNEFKKKKDELKDNNKKVILSKYGGEEHLKAPPKELLEQNEVFVEYSRTGRVITGGVEAKPTKSKYKEDVFPLNHSSVWGSWWTEGKWGYRCCKQVLRNAYCTGKALGN